MELNKLYQDASKKVSIGKSDYITIRPIPFNLRTKASELQKNLAQVIPDPKSLVNYSISKGMDKEVIEATEDNKFITDFLKNGGEMIDNPDFDGGEGFYRFLIETCIDKDDHTLTDNGEKIKLTVDVILSLPGSIVEMILKEIQSHNEDYTLKNAKSNISDGQLLTS